MAATTVTTTMAGAINYTVVTDSSADWSAVSNSTYFYDKVDKLVHYKDSTGTVLEIFSSGSGSTPIINGTIGIAIDGAGSTITNGTKGYIVVPENRTITGWYIVGSPSGSIVIDIWKTNAALPTVLDTISGSEKPTLISTTYNSDVSLSTWTTTILSGDVIAFNVDSVSSVTSVTVVIVTTTP